MTKHLVFPCRPERRMGATFDPDAAVISRIDLFFWLCNKVFPFHSQLSAQLGSVQQTSGVAPLHLHRAVATHHIKQKRCCNNTLVRSIGSLSKGTVSKHSRFWTNVSWHQHTKRPVEFTQCVYMMV